MNVVDSSAWLEYFADGSNADDFAVPILDSASQLVPTITLFEVFKRVLNQRGADAALEATAIMRRGLVVDLDPDLAIEAAELSADHQLPMSDSIILATAQWFGATLWTQDSDFSGFPNTEYRPHRFR